MSFMEKLFGNFSDKELKRIKPIANKVLELEPEMQKLTDEELQAKTPYLKEKLKNGASLDDILPEAFAVCREADWRMLGLKPYPVQIIGGIVLHRSCIAEMQTGEGKTLVATMPVYLNALTGACCYRQRLPGQARQRMDGQGLPLSWLDGRPGYP